MPDSDSELLHIGPIDMLGSVSLHKIATVLTAACPPPAIFDPTPSIHDVSFHNYF